jgi:hypothetical protein
MLRNLLKPKSLVAVTLLCVGAFFSMATSVPPARYRVPTRAFIDYTTGQTHCTEVLVTNDTNRPLSARFAGPSNRVVVLAPGSSTRVDLAPGRYAFELKSDKRVLHRTWKDLRKGRRYYYFHR